MLRQDQGIALLMVKNRLNEEESNPFGYIPKEVAYTIINAGYDRDPNSEIGQALALAADGQKEAMAELVKRVEAKPELLLQVGDVMTRGGVFAVRKTIYEFLLGEGDPAGAKLIEPAFEKIIFLNGEKERMRQYEQYRPHIEALAKQIELKQPTFDLKPLIDLIKNSSAEDIKEALAKNMEHKSELCVAMRDFRNAVRPSKEKRVGMHYAHYTTLQQAMNLLGDEKEHDELSDYSRNNDKCDLIWQQIIGYLMRSLPAVDRFAFARALADTERTLNFKHKDTESFPDCRGDADGDFCLSGLGFDGAIFGSLCSELGRNSALFEMLSVKFTRTYLTRTCRLASFMEQGSSGLRLASQACSQ